MRHEHELTNNETEDLWTVADVGRRLRLSTAKVYALTKSGELECYRFGRSVRISEAQLQRYLAAATYEVKQFCPSRSRHF